MTFNATASPSGFTKEQLYSTASYQQRNLRSVSLDGDLSGWNFSDQDLRSAQLNNLSNAKLIGANLTGARLGGKLDNADFTNASLRDATIGGTTLAGANFAGAIVAGANLSKVSGQGFTDQQLYSTGSYQQHDLRGISLGPVVAGWDFSHQNLTGASLPYASAANLSHADLTDATVTMVEDADFTAATISGATINNISAEQLYSTLSYQEKDLRGVQFPGFVSAFDFSGQDLAGAKLGIARSANFSGANLTNAFIGYITGQNCPAPQSLVRPSLVISMSIR